MHYYKHTRSQFDNVNKIRTLPAVYVLSTQDFEYIKIGKTVSLRQRIVNIQSGCPFDLNLWLLIRTPIPCEIEKYLHSAMSHCRTRGEWFLPSENDLDYLVGFFAKTNTNIREVYNALL